MHTELVHMEKYMYVPSLDLFPSLLLPLQKHHQSLENSIL